MYELIYTSVPRGLLLGRSGFCPVAWTQGMPTNYIAFLDRMDSYIHHLPDQVFDVEEPLVCYSCRYCKFGRRSLVLVSRIVPAGLDFQGKDNKIAHHLIFVDEQKYLALPEGGISVCLAEENFLSRWEQAPGLLPPFSPQTRSLNSNIAQQWQSITGDAGWAGVIAEFFLRNLSPGFYIEYPPSTPARILLELTAEISRLLPKSRLLEFTFSTFFIQTPVNWDCYLRFCQSDSPLLSPLRQAQAKHFLSFMEPQPIPAEWQEWDLVKVARFGLPSREQQMLTVRDRLDEDTKKQVLAIPGEDSEDANWALKKSDETLVNFVTTDGKNAAIAKAKRHRRILILAVILILGVVFGLSYYAFSLLRLEQELAEAQRRQAVSVVKPEVEEEGSLSSEPMPDTYGVAAVKPVGGAAFTISAEEEWCLYQAWEDKLARISLPASLAAAELVHIELQSIAQQRDFLPKNWQEQAIFSRESGRVVEVLPFRLGSSQDAEQTFEVYPLASALQRLRVSLPDLQITFPAEDSSGLKLPCHADVLRLDFRCGQEVWSFIPRFQPEFLAFLKRGQLANQNWVLSYQASADEKKYGAYLSIFIGQIKAGDVQRFPLADWIKQWNAGVLKMGESEQKLGLLRLKAREEIRRYYAQARKYSYTATEWEKQMTDIKAQIDPLLLFQQGNSMPEQLQKLLFSLEKAMLTQYDHAFAVFYQKKSSLSVGEQKKAWKAENLRLQQSFLLAAELFRKVMAREPALLSSFSLLEEGLAKLPIYCRQLEEYGRDEAVLTRDYTELETKQILLSENLLDFAKITETTEFFEFFLHSHQLIPFTEMLCRAYAVLLNRNLSYQWIAPSDQSGF